MRRERETAREVRDHDDESWVAMTSQDSLSMSSASCCRSGIGLFQGWVGDGISISSPFLSRC